MTAPQGLFTFPGINQIVSGGFSFTHGRSPSVASVTILPQQNWPAQGGALSIIFGGGVIQFPDCKVDSINFTRDESGQLVRLQILDRRWKWAWGWISGEYNIRNPDGSIKDGTKKTPQELAELLLDQMGEQDYVVGDLPNETTPYVKWDFDVPSEMLAQLCDSLNCRIVLGLDNRVRLLREGQGAQLDTSYVMDVGSNVNPPEMPDRLAVVSAPVRYQVELELEPVGREAENAQGEADNAIPEKFLPLDELSYKPAGGWKLEEQPYWISVAEDQRATAQQTVLKCFRVKVPFNLPPMGGLAPVQITKLDQFELLDERVEIIKDQDGNDVVRSGPARVRGVYFPNQIDTKNNIAELKATFQIGDVIDKPFTVDSASKVVTFQEPIYRNETADGMGEGYPDKVTVSEPQLRLRAAIIVQDQNTRGTIRYTRERQTGATFGTPTRFSLHDEIIVAVIAKYNDAFNIIGSEDNREGANLEMDHYLDALQAEYQLLNPQQVTYPGIVPVQLDGAISQVSWSVGLSGARTEATRNNESRRLSMPYRELRRMQREQAEVKRLARNAADPLLNGKRPARFIA